MKFTKFNVIPFNIPFINSFQTSFKKYINREGLWLIIQSEDLYGYGEASPLLGFSHDSLKEARYALESFNQATIDENLDKEEIQLLIDVHAKDTPSAKFALETAVLDLFAQKSKQNIAEYLNPNFNKKIAVNGIAGFHQLDEGFKVIKVKVGFKNLFDEIENIESLTRFYGDEIKFRLDLNAMLDLPRAIRYCKEMEKFNIDYIEQPLPADNLEDCAELRNHTTIPIALDESLLDAKTAEKIIEMKAADIFVIKPMISGGFSESKKIIDLAKSEHIRSVITTLLETHIGQAGCLHLASANEIKETCGLATGIFFKDSKSSISINCGQALLPDNWGLGVKLNI